MDRKIKWETEDKQFPAGTVAGGFHIEVTDGADNKVFDVGGEAAEIVVALSAGSWTVSVHRVDANGVALQDPVKKDFVVEDDSQVTISVVKSVDVSDPSVTIAVASAVTA